MPRNTAIIELRANDIADARQFARVLLLDRTYRELGDWLDLVNDAHKGAQVGVPWDNVRVSVPDTARNRRLVAFIYEHA